MRNWIGLVVLVICSVAVFAQKRESQYRSDGKNTFAVSILPGYDRFTRTFGLGFEGSYSRLISSFLDIRVYQRYHRMVDESQFYLNNVLVHSYLLTGVVTDISIVRYEKFFLKVSVGPQLGYAYKIKPKDSDQKPALQDDHNVFAGFNMGATFETYPAKKLVLGLRINYDQLFSNGDGIGNIYPGPFIGVKF
jgi:hypothetical protein